MGGLREDHMACRIPVRSPRSLVRPRIYISGFCVGFVWVLCQPSFGFGVAHTKLHRTTPNPHRVGLVCQIEPRPNPDQTQTEPRPDQHCISEVPINVIALPPLQ